METKPIYDIYFDSSINTVVMNWIGYANSKELREGTERMLSILKESNAQKVLANCSDMILIGMEDQHWIENSFLPRAIKEGFKVIAIVRPRSYFNQVAMESIASNLKARNLLQIKIFETSEDAVDWIASFK